MSWAAFADYRTEIRSVPLAGGPITTVHTFTELGVLDWPWMSIRHDESQQGYNLETNETTEATITPNEAISCGARWCRVTTLNTGMEYDDYSWVKVELMRPDGSDRRVIAVPDVRSPEVDVALLNRFDLLTSGGSRGSGKEPIEAPKPHGLLLYDITTGRTFTVAPDVVNIATSDPVIWWSTGAESEQTWHALDLRTLMGNPR